MESQTPPLETLHYPTPGQVRLAGRLAARCQGNQRYLADLFEQKQAWMLEPFQKRGQDWVIEPLRYRKQESAWAGEYAGKWLDAATLASAGGQDPQLGAYAATLAAGLIAAQADDGYLGIEAPDQRGAGDWDVWNVKYALTGLLTYAEVHFDRAALEAAARGGACLLEHFGPVNPSHPFLRGPYEGAIGVSVTDQLVRLATATGDPRLLAFVALVVASFPPVAKMRATHQAPHIHAYNLAAYLGGVAALAAAEHRPDELAWLEAVWEDLAGRHLYPTGSLGFGEELRATAPNDTPVDGGRPNRHHQETCATVEWLLFSAQLFQVTGRVRYVQAMEHAIYNALLAAQSRDGQRWLYFLPLRYEKRWFTGPTSCCYWSGPRGLARLPQWVYALDADGLRVNLYEASEATLQLPGGSVTVQQVTNYPADGQVHLQLQPTAPMPFTLRLRIPFDAAQTRVRLNGQPLAGVPVADGYFVLHRTWAAGDTVDLDFSIPVTVRPFMNDDYGVVVRGPEVLAVDQADNGALDLDAVTLPAELALTPLDPIDGRWRYAGTVEAGGQPVTVVFTPYADCGDRGSRFRTAFPVSR